MAKKKLKSAKRLHAAHHFFTSTRENGGKPHLLHRNIVASGLLVAILVEFGSLSQAITGFHGGTLTASVLPSVVEALTNDQRTAQGDHPLTVNALLTEAAQLKANDMAAKGYFAHVAPDGTEPWHWFNTVGYDYEYAGENLAIDFDDSQQLVSAWMNSPAHRENILKPEYTEIGVGMATGTYQGKETLFVVQFFAKPVSAASASAAAAAPSKPTETAQASHPQETQSVAAAPETQTSDVLGAQTSDAAQVASPSFWNLLQASPLTYATYALLALLGYFGAMLLLSFVAAGLPGRRLPHPSTVVNGLAVMAIVLGIVVVNQKTIVSVQLPASDVSASVAAALQ